mgnify:CR=1 FL=1
MRQRVLFITTSSGLPRDKTSDRVEWNETYVNLIRTRRPYINIIHIGVPAAPIAELIRIAGYYKLAQPDVIVLQSGLVDCAPRALTIFEFEIIKRLRLFRVVKRLKRILRKYRNVYYTKPKDFEAGIQRLKMIFPQAKIISCGILPARQAYEDALPGVSRRIKEFNEILKRNTHFIDNSDFPDFGIAADHHHLTAEGNRLVAEKVIKAVDSLADDDHGRTPSA